MCGVVKQPNGYRWLNTQIYYNYSSLFIYFREPGTSMNISSRIARMWLYICLLQQRCDLSFMSVWCVPCFAWLSWVMESWLYVTGWWGNGKDEDKCFQQSLFFKTPAGLVNHGKLQWTQKNNHILVCFCCLCCYFRCWLAMLVPPDGRGDLGFFKEREESSLPEKQRLLKFAQSKNFYEKIILPQSLWDCSVDLLICLQAIICLQQIYGWLRDFITSRVAIKIFPRFY